MKKTATPIRDHANLEDKLWYGTDILISRHMGDNAPLPGPMKCSMWGLILCDKGSISYKLNMKPMTWVAPSLMLVTPDTILECIETSPDTSGCAITFSTEFVKNLNIFTNYHSVGSVIHKPIFNLTEDDLETYYLYFNLVFKLVNHPKTPVNDMLIANVLQSFINFFLHRYEEFELNEEQNDFKSRGEYICSEFLKLVNHHVVEHRKLTYYAGKMNLSEKYLSNVIKRVTGKSPSHWIRWSLVQHATSMLFDLTKSIQQISDELLFSTPSHFTAYFKKEMGCTPKSYRQNLGK
ncbi:MAG: helix-turn-helix domain-containing protein [Bacteroidales bacterium]|nr:helix-turn-helix domain-containing protein [Bacteroidales bacterium]